MTSKRDDDAGPPTWRPLVSAARSAGAVAANNAHWCDIVCRTHGLEPTLDDDAWTSSTRTPLHYPDAVTLVPDLPVTELLARIEVSEGCSVKDSFASLDLAPHGFRVLFEAEWIVRSPSGAKVPTVGTGWEIVGEPGGFVTWEQAWRGDHRPPAVLLVDLLIHESVTVLAEYAGDRIVAGAILNRTGDVVGISNFFALPDTVSASWSGCVAFAGALFPTSTMVGYHAGGASRPPPGFDSAGPLRVWLHEE